MSPPEGHLIFLLTLLYTYTCVCKMQDYLTASDKRSV